MASPGGQDANTPESQITAIKVMIDDHDDIAAASDSQPPPASASTSAPELSDGGDIKRYPSPMRHHKRAPSAHREIKETLDARSVFASDDSDGRTQHRINQYIIQEEIGRGSYGAVHLAKDQYGTEYAVKEFSKARLRRRAQSNILRQGPRQQPKRFRSNFGAGISAHSLGVAPSGERDDALYLIREELAIMKKLDHPNLVQLIEVLDDPEEDSLYMVMEMCKKGVIMKVGLDEEADPYSEESCRCWFRDLILGIEYLHAQGVIHRDIKPDNLLLSDDEVLKVVDFGVSEMFEIPTDMKIAKAAGSPAFLAPELCGKHGSVSGTAADIWSMGVSLYCLKYGKIPFNREGVLEMYEAIKTEEPRVPEDENPDFVDLMRKLLEKDPDERITMDQLREHPWVTRHGTDPLLSAEENCANMVEPPNELELNRAFTRKMNHLFYVMTAIHRFRAVLAKKYRREGHTSQSSTLSQARLGTAKEQSEAAEIEHLIKQRRNFLSQGSGSSLGEKGHAHDVKDHEPLFLGIGTGARDDFAMDTATPDVVSDSPVAVDFNVYDRAYEDAIEHIQSKLQQTAQPTIYLTKFVKDKDHFKELENVMEGPDVTRPHAKVFLENSRE